MQITCSDRKQICHPASPAPQGQEGVRAEDHKGAGGEGFVHYFHDDADVTVVYMSKLITLYT